MARTSARRRVVRIEDGVPRDRDDLLAAEEPLEIRIGGAPLAVTMRTPGDDFDLVAGFLHAEGVAAARDDIASMRYCVGEDLQEYNVVDVVPGPGALVPGAPLRATVTTSACGVCGSRTIEDLDARAHYDLREDDVRLPAALLSDLPPRMRDAQRAFEATGGLHAAALFDRDGALVCLREDVGRHNAVDKVVGERFLAAALPLRGHVLLVSGRASFELVQKAMLAGVPVLAAVSAPSTLAVELAEAAGMTLVGFLRGATMNVYAEAHRVTA